MAKHRMRGWIPRLFRKRRKDRTETKSTMTACVLAKKFSPLTYQNPCICYMQSILNQVMRNRNLTYQNLELILIDAQQEADDEDIEEILWQICGRLNYLLLVTDRPYHYEAFICEMFEQTGLIVQQVPKSQRNRARGNLILDFERSENNDPGTFMRTDAIYLPIYKKQWEIAENLDITVPVGYNTLVVESLYLPRPEERLKNHKIDRLDREFRKG